MTGCTGNLDPSSLYFEGFFDVSILLRWSHFHDFKRAYSTTFKREVFFFIKPVDKTEIQNTVLSLNPLKAVGLNSILTKILKLLSNDISDQLSGLFNPSFTLGVFLNPKI